MTSRSEKSVPDLGDFRIGDWQVRPSESRLYSPERTVRLEPRVMDVLVYLAAHSGRVVPKDELLAVVWPDTVVEEGALPQCIHSIRKALGDDARRPSYVQTVPKRGYRLIVQALPEVAETSPEEAEARPPQRPSGLRRSLAVAGLVTALVVSILVWTSRRVPKDPESGALPATAPASTVRIVVLPFENLGEPEDAYFAEGLTEEITKDLAGLSSLQVISRTTAVSYSTTGKTVSEIGDELGLDYVLEGTVRWARGDGGRRVRVTPQLIRVADDAHVWARAFDLTVDDIFEVQAEISQRVIGMLGVSLLPPERRSIEVAPTRSLEAYRAYLRGLELKNQPFYSEEHLLRAVPMFERAVELDDEFAEAWAELSQTHSYLAFNSDRSPKRTDQARAALERSRALAPELPAVRLAAAYYSYRCLEDYDRALVELTAAAAGAPNHAEVLRGMGFVLRRLGRLAEAAEYLRRSFSIDPRTVKVVWTLAETYRALRQHADAEEYYEQAISLAPDQPFFWEEKVRNRLAWTGSTARAREVLAEAPIGDDVRLLPAAAILDLFDRDYPGFLKLFAEANVDQVPSLTRCHLASLAVVAHDRLGDPTSARVLAERNRAELERILDRFPGEPYFRAYLAVALAQLGDEEKAVREADAAVRQKSPDRFSGLRIVELRARVDTILGRREEAIGRLETLLATPYQLAITVPEVRLDPGWDPLRGHPRFESLLRRHE